MWSPAMTQVQPDMCFARDKVQALRAGLPDPVATARLAEILKATAHPGRLAVLQLLTREECCVCDIAHTLEMPVSTVSQHLQRLRRAGLVHGRQEGKWVFYSLSESAGIVGVLAALNPEAA